MHWNNRRSNTFAAADPIRVIPSICTGSAVASVISLLLKCGNHAPWGGLIVLPIVDNRIGYVIAAIAGTIVTAIMVILLKKDVKDNAPLDSEKDEDNEEIELKFE